MVGPDRGQHPEPAVALAFGPIPSRRLGRSLGVNNIPPKVCSYGCVCCQVGATPSPQLEPRPIYPPERLAAAVTRHVDLVRAREEPIDHLTFAPDGEPTLDANLGRAVELLRPLAIPVAVITNGSLAWRPEVREALRAADWVSVKVDAVDEEVWRRVNRPPAEPGVRGPDEAVVARAHAIVAERVPHVEYLVGYEGDAFAASGDARADLLSITAVHPLRDSAVRELLRRSGSG